MPTSVKELIRQRRSVRTYDGRALSQSDRQLLEKEIARISNPFGVPVCLRLLEAKEHALSSPVILGAQSYLAGKVKKTEHFEMAFGYSFERACLYALSLGLGTVMLAASLSRASFERAMALEPGEVLPVASPVGYPAQKMSLRESLMRKGIHADTRKPFESIFFQDSFDKPLSQAEADPFGEALELARWAPSAANRQPWRAVRCGDRVHFYEAKSMKDSPLGDVQKLDVGIALCHFDLTLAEEGKRGRFRFEDPGLPTPETCFYQVSWVLEQT